MIYRWYTLTYKIKYVDLQVHKLWVSGAAPLKYQPGCDDTRRKNIQFVAQLISDASRLYAFQHDGRMHDWWQTVAKELLHEHTRARVHAHVLARGGGSHVEAAGTTGAGFNGHFPVIEMENGAVEVDVKIQSSPFSPSFRQKPMSDPVLVLDSGDDIIR